MKKLAIAVCTAALCAAVVFAGGGKDAAVKDPNAPVTLTVWCWDPMFNIFAMNEAAKIYKTDHPNVTVQVVETPWPDLQQKLITSLSSGQTETLPDIILCQDNAIQKNVMNYKNAFLPLNGKVDLSRFAQFKVGSGTIDGKSYAVPFDNGVTGTFLRRDIIEQAGLRVSDFNDITWERFIELGKTVKAATGKPMVSTMANEPDFIMIMLQSCGIWLFDDAGNPYLKDNAALREAVRLYAEMIKEGICIQVPDWNAYIATLNNGSVAATINGCWIIGSISAEKSQSGKWAVVNTPRFASISRSVNYSNQGGSSWMIMAASKNADTAADFLSKTFGGSVKLYETILPASGAIATWLPAAESSVYAEPNAFFGGQKIYEDLVRFAGKVPLVKYGVFNYEARDAIGQQITDIVSGKKTIEKALADAQKQVEFLMGM
ncbi:ABC transporter substrate-binding protein [Treponema brennaborense]|uniref:Extracellular solute-binding protein family 1 n=1 Tax=Treponema brennaborense (strain DSM 12168 / CIP 105900 / DD5/3) TaxID=906968 RepID=F4LL96_TREBD|nr:ABC transporter substrate-binding protein [Treponema brennaborense]AEE15574.1 extracellular solute-binding protein family 1 [Treponema brennaborense DSM 12168]